jgi:hypothetical protein
MTLLVFFCFAILQCITWRYFIKELIQGIIHFLSGKGLPFPSSSQFASQPVYRTICEITETVGSVSPSKYDRVAVGFEPKISDMREIFSFLNNICNLLEKGVLGLKFCLGLAIIYLFSEK